MSEDLRIGVIGVGVRSSLAWNAHKPGEGSVLVGACDINKASLEKFKEKFGNDVFLTTDYKELLKREDIDAVFIISPDHMHHEHTVASLKAGKHVYLEKPMAITVEDCDDILRTAYQCKKKLYLGHNMRHMPVILKMKELIDAGKIGEVKTCWCRHFVAYGGDAYFKDWHAERSKTTSLLLQKAAHDIDIIHWLCGGYSEKVNGMGELGVYNNIQDRHPENEIGDASFNIKNWPPMSQKQLNPNIDVEDLSMIQMKLDNGVLASYAQCHYSPDAWRSYTIIGTEGKIENFGDFATDSVVRLWNTRTTYNPYGDEQFYFPLQEGTHGGADCKIVDEFLRYVRFDKPISTSAIAARNSVAAGCCATESLRNGSNSIAIPEVEREIEKYFG